MSDAAGAVVLAGRILFAFMFAVMAGFMGHIRQSQAMEGYARSSGFPVPVIAGWPTGVWLILGSLSVALGIYGDVGAIMIALFLIPTAILFHRFWEIEDQMQQVMQNGFFFRNVIGTAACLILFGLFTGLGEDLPYTITGPLFSL